MTDLLTFIEQTARAAGDLLREGYGRAQHIEYKGAVDLVTEYDHLSETLILGRLRAAYPEHAIRAEESGRLGASAEFEWWVDPVDGTTNFAHGFPIFAVSIALARRGQVIAGAVYDPTRDEMFLAEAGQGAALNGTRLRVSAETRLDRALLTTGFPYDVRTNPENNFAQFMQFYKRAQAVRRPGAAALDCAYVAAGRVDGYWELGTKPWDIAAGALLVREAGGRVTTTSGSEVMWDQPTVLMTNGHLHAAMLRVLREGDAAPLPA
ncbi:MAG: inositol monophosphatase [Anaerolineales bacterium]|nr:inositol monophosphatase [Anaerolineales bacterium]